MNPRQRRGVLLILVTVLGAVVTFVAMFSYVQSISSQVGPMTTVLKLSQQVTELKEITAADVVTEQVPKRWVPEDAIHDVNDLKGKVAAATLNKGAVLQTSMLQDPPQLTEGYREVSIMIDAETGVAGKVTPGSRVDIVSTVENPRIPKDAEVGVHRSERAYHRGRRDHEGSGQGRERELLRGEGQCAGDLLADA